MLQLAALLLRHIVLGSVYSAGVQENQVLKTVGGLELRMSIIPGTCSHPRQSHFSYAFSIVIVRAPELSC